ncbi:hypothetical protein TNCV_3109461 [Trichonephila clavipes]|nr:hypothetical protein TNCV_3109461 [Trichonephila clavipes]
MFHMLQEFRQASRTVVLIFTIHKEHRCAATHKPLNTKSNRAVLLSFRNWILEEWKQVLLSDESRFNLHHLDGRVLFWPKPGE